MSRLFASIYSGSDELVSSEQIICDDSAPLKISFPTVGGSTESITFIFVGGDTPHPEHTVKDLPGNSHITVKLGSISGSFLATKFKVPTVIGGKNYSYLFSLTRLIGNSVRVEFSLFEVKGLLG